ncbi:MAG: hypothetical protein KGL40_04950 [Rhodocyclaceae bacterium]|nr:hypothetical protein [Rhodocyclaceae bacterium]
MNQAALQTARKPHIVPFWDRLPQFFLFPLRPANLFVLGALSLGSLLAFVLPVMSPVDILLAEAIIWITALRHAFRVMDLTSYGRITVEEQQASFESDPDRVNLPWKMIGLFMIWGVAIGFLEAFSETLGWFANLFFVVATPAIIMQLSASNSLSSSLNPGTWIGYMRAIGWPYLALCFFLFMLLMGAPIAFSMLLPLIGKKALLPSINFVCLYFNLIMFYMTGYVMYQYHNELGLPAMVHFEDEDDTAAESDSVEAMIAARLAAGQIDEAITIARNASREAPQSIVVQERLLTLLRTGGQPEKARQQGERLFGLCLSQGDAERALGLYKEFYTDPAALAAEHILPLAKLASRQRDYALALVLVRGFDKRFPGHADIPGVYYFSAQLISEQFRQNSTALRILEVLLARFPEHPLAGDARQYLEVLRRMTAGEAGRAPA